MSIPNMIGDVNLKTHHDSLRRFCEWYAERECLSIREGYEFVLWLLEDPTSYQPEWHDWLVSLQGSPEPPVPLPRYTERMIQHRRKVI